MSRRMYQFLMCIVALAELGFITGCWGPPACEERIRKITSTGSYGPVTITQEIEYETPSEEEKKEEEKKQGEDPSRKGNGPTGDLLPFVPPYDGPYWIPPRNPWESWDDYVTRHIAIIVKEGELPTYSLNSGFTFIPDRRGRFDLESHRGQTVFYMPMLSSQNLGATVKWKEKHGENAAQIGGVGLFMNPTYIDEGALKGQYFIEVVLVGDWAEILHILAGMGSSRLELPTLDGERFELTYDRKTGRYSGHSLGMLPGPDPCPFEGGETD